MLYDRWRQIAREFSDELALRDFASGQSWTFAQLAAEAESCRSRGDAAQIVFPQGSSAEFILTILRAWRENQIICPLEPGQPSPMLGGASVPASRIVHLKTTSATSGPPRLVAFTAAQLAADAENVVATMGLRRDWPNLGVISLAHSYGFSNLVTPLLLHGIPLILAPAPLPETVRQAAAFAGNITLPAVPAMWRAWHAADSIPANVRLAISAGAPLPLALEQDVFAKRGLKIHNFYGASECGGIAYDASKTPRTDAACVGSPMKNVELSVADDGCLEVRSRAVAEGYLEDGGWKMEDGKPPVSNYQLSTINHQLLGGGGCFHTSDLAEIVERGRSPSAARGNRADAGKLSPPHELPAAASRDVSRSDIQIFLRGRAGDQINVAGRKVSPETIERVLLRHPGVHECLVFGVPSRDAERTEEIVAVVVWEHSSTLGLKSSPSPRSEARGEGRGEGQQHKTSSGLVEQTASSPRPSPPKEERKFTFHEREGVLRQFVLETLPAWQTPRHWLFVEALQTNPRGKVSRAEWRERWLAR